jgi:hypothetical protein
MHVAQKCASVWEDDMHKDKVFKRDVLESADQALSASVDS